MQKFPPLYLLLLFSILTIGCHAPRTLVNRGDYDNAVLSAAGKLKNDPAHSPSVQTLKQAFPNAVAGHLEDIALHASEPDLPKWELLMTSYQKLNTLYEAVKSCPSCMHVVKARSYYEEERNTKQKALEAHYAEGVKLLSAGDRQLARTAYEHFERINELSPNDPGVQQKLDTAYHLASFKVVVEPVSVTSKAYRLNQAYFQDLIQDFFKSNPPVSKFVRFYTLDEAASSKINPDHSISLRFEDFVVGQTLIEKNTKTVVSEDSVKIEEKAVNKKRVARYDKVKATLIINRKTVRSSGSLNLKIVDYKTKQQVKQEKFAGEYNWVCEWAQYSGDERALTTAQLNMCKNQELLPPDPQKLFVALSKPIYDRLTDRLRGFYAKY